MRNAQVDTRRKPTQDSGLAAALLYADEYYWGWWCPECTRPGVHIGQTQFKGRDSARRAAAKHEERRGHR